MYTQLTLLQKRIYVYTFDLLDRADDKTLESYSISAGATIHMVLQLRGGR